MVRLLMIALEFPPVQTTGSFRSFDFAKNFHKFGIEPHVISIDPEQGSEIFGANRNEALMADLPKTVKISRIKTPFGVRKGKFATFLRVYGTLDDTFYRRFERTLRTCLHKLKSEDAFDAVYVSAPPFGSAQLGVLAKQILNIPLILDMRDAWAAWDISHLPTRFHFNARLKNEAEAFKASDVVLGVTQELTEVFKLTHPSLPSAKFKVIPNGFNGALFKDETLIISARKADINIAYVGSFYYMPDTKKDLLKPHSWLRYRKGDEDWSYRSPLYFFKAFQALKTKYPDTAKRIKFHHFGRTPEWLYSMAQDFNIEDACIIHGMVPKQDVAIRLSKMDAVLATSMKREAGGDYCLASKTFDYLLSRKPILAFVTEGAQKYFLENSGGAILFNPDDTIINAEKLRNLALNGATLSLKSDFINHYHRHVSTETLASIINSLSSKK